MAECVISQTVGEDGPAWTCLVHSHYSPCPRDGQSANPNPVHTDALRGGHNAAVALWHLRTRGQRPLVIHRGSLADHHETSGTDCWCRPELLAAVDLTPNGGAHRG